MIELEDVWRTYEMGGESLHALAEVTETIEAGACSDSPPIS